MEEIYCPYSALIYMHCRTVEEHKTGCMCKVNMLNIYQYLIFNILLKTKFTYKTNKNNKSHGKLIKYMKQNYIFLLHIFYELSM